MAKVDYDAGIPLLLLYKIVAFFILYSGEALKNDIHIETSSPSTLTL